MARHTLQLAVTPVLDGTEIGSRQTFIVDLDTFYDTRIEELDRKLTQESFERARAVDQRDRLVTRLAEKELKRSSFLRRIFGG